MTNDDNTEQNEYEESFKRFKTLFIVGAACFCLGVTVVILGNRFQLYEVQRLGIIFSSFGVGWIVLAIAYLVYMKWCFIPGDNEITPQQTLGRNLAREGSMAAGTSRALPSPSEMPVTTPPAEANNLNRHSSVAGRIVGRSKSLVQNVKRLPSSTKDSESPSSNSQSSFERRSYSVRYAKGSSYSGRDSKRLASSLKNFEKPLFSQDNIEKRTSFVSSRNMSLSRGMKFKILPIPAGKSKSPSPSSTASAEKYFEELSSLEKGLPSGRYILGPLPELKNFESQLASMDRYDYQSPSQKKFDKPKTPLAALEKSFESQVPTVQRCESCNRQFQSSNNSDAPPEKNHKNSLPSVEQSYNVSTNIAPVKCFPPEYYEVVMCTRKSDE